MSTTTKYPEHDKFEPHKADGQAIGGFLDWLQNHKGLYIASRHIHDKVCEDGTGHRMCGYFSDELQPVYMNTETWLAEYFEIDLRKYKAEKDQMLQEWREAQGL